MVNNPPGVGANVPSLYLENPEKRQKKALDSKEELQGYLVEAAGIEPAFLIYGSHSTGPSITKAKRLSLEATLATWAINRPEFLSC